MITQQKEKLVENRLEGYPPELLEMKLSKIRECM
jgi:hypothetical protein